MKDIKSVMIGFLLATCMFLFMGQTLSDTQVGRYDLEIDVEKGRLLVFDTKKGQLVKNGMMVPQSPFKPYQDYLITWYDEFTEVNGKGKN